MIVVLSIHHIWLLYSPRDFFESLFVFITRHSLRIISFIGTLFFFNVSIISSRNLLSSTIFGKLWIVKRVGETKNNGFLSFSFLISSSFCRFFKSVSFPSKSFKLSITPTFASDKLRWSCFFWLSLFLSRNSFALLSSLRPNAISTCNSCPWSVNGVFKHASASSVEANWINALPRGCLDTGSITKRHDKIRRWSLEENSCFKSSSVVSNGILRTNKVRCSRTSRLLSLVYASKNEIRIDFSYENPPIVQC